MASINPLRYRGYYYDTDTGWYYLQSRYYDPEIGRFINADLPEYTAEFSLDDNNLFAYCGNNPLLRDDKDGKFGNVVIGALVGAAVNAVSTAIDSYISTGSIDWGSVGISAAVGAVSGGVAATGLGTIMQAGITAAASFTGSIASDLHARGNNPNAGKMTWKELGKISLRAVGEAAIGFGASIFGSAVGKTVSNKLNQKGADMVFKGGRRIGCYSKAQARSLVRHGKAVINTARGLSSVVGTFFSWPTAKALSNSIRRR